MDHFELGRVAALNRQFVEADTHFSRVDDTLPADKVLLWRELQFTVAKVLRTESCWRELRVWIKQLVFEQQLERVLEVLELEHAAIPEQHAGFVHEHKAQIYFQKGELALSREAAMKHVNYLLKKKVTHQLLTFAKKYQTYFPQALYFGFLQLQAAALLEDVASSKSTYQYLLESMLRRWTRLEDTEHASKEELLSTALDTIQWHDTGAGEAVLLGHYAFLNKAHVAGNKLQKEDWKKVIELIVQGDEWSHLKLCLELAIAHKETDIALEAYAALKRKKGFSFVKLTKYDNTLKAWLLENGGMRPARSTSDEKPIVLTAEDLRLEDETPANKETPTQETWDEDAEELGAIELNAIKQIQLHAPALEAYPDLLVTYKTLGFLRVVGWLLDSFDIESATNETKKKIAYFRVLHSLDLNQPFMALAQLEEMLGDESMTLDEYKELKYAQGSIQFKLGRRSEAKISFREVEKVDPNYRQIRERMQKIAES